MTVKYSLPRDFVAEVRAASDILRVIGKHVNLRKRGKNHVGLCPFHDEKTPSFNVSPDQQFYYCFGCGAGGDVIKFLMEHDKMTFHEAVVELAKAAHLKIPQATREERERETQSAAIVEVNEAALGWFLNQLNGGAGAAVREYLAGRGIGAEAVAAFEIGFAPDALSGLYNNLREGFDLKLLEDAGLVQRSTVSGDTIDRFRKRIIIPIRSASGRLIAFGGRVYGEGEPKYLNSPETTVFRKSRNLYGLDRAGRVIRKRNFAVVVEGYFDAIVLHMNGFENAVAPLGTSLTEEQAKLLRRYTEKAIICMDADEAGQRAAVRASGLLLEHGFTVNIAPLPAGEDPDSYLRGAGAEEFGALLRGSKPAYGYVLRGTSSRYDLTRPYGKREALAELLPLLDRIKDPLERSHALSETAAALGIEEHVVATELKAVRNSQSYTGKAVSRVEKQSLDWLPAAERKLLLAAVRDPRAGRQAVEELDVAGELSGFTGKVLGRIFELSGSVDSASFSGLMDLAENEAERNALAALAVEFESEMNPANAYDCCLSVAVGALRRRVAELSGRIARLETGDQQTSDELYFEKKKLLQRIFSLESSLKDRNRPPGRVN